ncbi:hypothetical protein [Burkholderia cepacia]|uniref:hypothetical protein n=1 Tax=Burkholderia cepacia TaxID=292 RepID=UPI00178583C6|nr:hypothetical protein [Burkholderia cepacia]
MAADSGVLRGMIVVRSSFAMRDLSPVISLFRVASANTADASLAVRAATAGIAMPGK